MSAIRTRHFVAVHRCHCRWSIRVFHIDGIAQQRPKWREFRQELLRSMSTFVDSADQILLPRPIIYSYVIPSEVEGPLNRRPRHTSRGGPSTGLRMTI